MNIDLTTAYFLRLALAALVVGFCGAAGVWTWNTVIAAVRRGP